MCPCIVISKVTSNVRKFPFPATAVAHYDTFLYSQGLQARLRVLRLVVSRSRCCIPWRLVVLSCLYLCCRCSFDSTQDTVVAIVGGAYRRGACQGLGFRTVPFVRTRVDVVAATRGTFAKSFELHH